MWRTLGLVVLALAVAGFGVCSLCGGVMGLSMLSESKSSSHDIAWFAFGCSALGVLLGGLCWWGFRSLRRKRPAG